MKGTKTKVSIGTNVADQFSSRTAGSRTGHPVPEPDSFAVRFQNGTKFSIGTEQIYMDATFRTAPKPYKQMFTVLGDYSGRVVPLITALMTNCTVGDYRQVFQMIKHSIRTGTQNCQRNRNTTHSS